MRVRPMDDDDFDTAPPLPASFSPITAEPLAVPVAAVEGTRKRRKSLLTDLAYHLHREAQEARGEAPVPSSMSAPNRRPTLADFIASTEREKAEREAREEVRKAEEREYRRARYQREKALKAGLPAPPPPVSPAGRRREAERVARELERERWIELARSTRTAQGAG